MQSPWLWKAGCVSSHGCMHHRCLDKLLGFCQYVPTGTNVSALHFTNEESDAQGEVIRWRSHNQWGTEPKFKFSQIWWMSESRESFFVLCDIFGYPWHGRLGKELTGLRYVPSSSDYFAQQLESPWAAVGLCCSLMRFFCLCTLDSKIE